MQSITKPNPESLSPLLRYAGGKTWLVPRIAELLVAHRKQRFVELFAGSAAVTLALMPGHALLNDVNRHVINLYQQIRDGLEPRGLENTAEWYAQTRDEFNAAIMARQDLSAENAWRFYALNKLCFNGLCRFNGSGLFNVPFGDVKRPKVLDTFLPYRVAFSGWKFTSVDFAKAPIGPDDVLYCFVPGNFVRTYDEQLIPIEEVREGDILFGGKSVKRTFAREYTGSVYRITAVGIPDALTVTGGHPVLRVPRRPGRSPEWRKVDRLWREREVVPARDVVPGDYLLVPLGGSEARPQWQWNDRPRGSVPRKAGLVFTDCPELYRFLGYVAAEGSSQRQGYRTTAIVLTFGAHEVDTWAADASRCAQVAFNDPAPVFSHQPTSSTTSVRITSSTIAEFVTTYIRGGIQPERYLHQDLMTAPISMQMELLIGWLRGDGGLDKGTRSRAKLVGTSSSEILARQFYLIGLRCGLRPSFRQRGSRIFQVSFSSEDAKKLGWKVDAVRFRSSRRVVNGHILCRVTSVISDQYSGPVYNVEVDGDHLITAPFAATHNCDPPYDDSFDTYSGTAFTWADQVRLVKYLGKHSGPVIVSNAATDRVLDLYRSEFFTVTTIAAPRSISAKAESRGPVQEMLAYRGLVGVS